MSYDQANALAGSTSPYLLQHADNPVHWQPWGRAAFDRAQQQDKPVFLSVGYSTCHWCHVMAHESFEHEQVAAVLNEHFVPIKVDREQLPDVDAHYMLATQAFYMLAGQPRVGGWPNSVWLMPDGRPFYAGTYFVRDPFIELNTRLAELWARSREQLQTNAQAIGQMIERMSRIDPAERATLSPELIDTAVAELLGSYDAAHGGLGAVPKFPPHGALALLADRIAAAERPGAATPDTDGDTRSDARAMFFDTLEAIRRGGIHDHIGGGFHRYATDRRWFLPHFEKMLYDNAQLLLSYADGAALSDDALQVDRFRAAAAGIYDWLMREMRDPAGGFYSALDADSEGEEGKFYVWTADEVRQVLGDDDAALFADAYGLADEGNWVEEASGHRPGTNIAYLPQPLDRVALQHGTEVTELGRRLAGMREKLLQAREQRVRPHLDDKVLAGWNGLMIEGLAHAGRLLDEPRFIDAAADAAAFVLGHMRDDSGGLLRTWRQGQAGEAAYLEDYAYLINALLALDDAVPRPDGPDPAAGPGEASASQTPGPHLVAARELADGMIERFADQRHGGFYFTAADYDHGGPTLLRSKNPSAGGNMPSANGAAARALLQLAKRDLDRRGELVGQAAQTLSLFAGRMAQYPHGSEEQLRAAAVLLRDPALREHLPPAPTPEGSELGAGLGATGETGANAVTASAGPVHVTASVPERPAAPGDAAAVALRIRVEPPYHIYGPDVDDATVTATQVRLIDADGATLGRIDWPPTQAIDDPASGRLTPTYEGEIALALPIRIDPVAPANGPLEVTIEVLAQPCDDRSCLEPAALRLNLALPLASE